MKIHAMEEIVQSYIDKNAKESASRIEKKEAVFESVENLKRPHPRIEHGTAERKEEKLSKEENDTRKDVDARKRTRRTRLQKENQEK